MESESFVPEPERIEYEKENWSAKLMEDVPADSELSTLKHMDFYEEFHEDPADLNEFGQPQIKKRPKEYMTEYLSNLSTSMKSNSKFTDKSFPANNASLEGDGTNHYSKDWLEGPRPCSVWKRPTDFFGEKNFNLFKDKIEPADIKQGAIGNCYFMAAIAALAENPQRVQRLFISRDVSPFGCYCLNVCDEGLWKSIIIDDLVPCYNADGQPAFARGNGNEIWVMILEKIWAKLYGGYSNIEGGWAREVLNELTGAPCTSYGPDCPILFDKIVEATAGKWVMTTASNTGSGSHDKKSEKGISHNHLYSLLGAYNVNRGNKEYKIVKLRNPWGHTEWKGEWGDNWNGWTPDLRASLKLEMKEDGVFCMPFEEFVKEFRRIEICRYYDFYKFTCLKTKSPHNKIRIFEIDVRKKGAYYFIICQKNQRKFSKKSGYTYSVANLRIGSTENGKFGYEKSENNPAKEKNIDTWIYAELEKKKYLVGIRIQWYNLKEADYVFKVYGPDHVEIKNVNQKDYPFFFV